MIKQQLLWVLRLTASMATCFLPAFAFGESYDLGKVNGIEVFDGSTAAKGLLGKWRPVMRKIYPRFEWKKPIPPPDT